MLLTARSKPLRVGKTVCSWSRPRVQAKPTPPFRSSGACGSRAPKKRILFLADRNILVDQTKNNDFKPFGAAMTKITKRQIDTSYEIYLSLYQAVSGNEEEKNVYKSFHQTSLTWWSLTNAIAAAQRKIPLGATSSITSPAPRTSAHRHAQGKPKTFPASTLW